MTGPRTTPSRTDIRVRFTFKRPGRIVAFRGPAADTTQPSFPIRAAFYYAWYPEAWWRDPSSRTASSTRRSTTTARPTRRRARPHRRLLYAHLNAGIYSWWGADGYPPTDLRFCALSRAARTTPLRWALYYEREGYGDPSVEQIRSDLEYIRDSVRAQARVPEGRRPLRRLRLRRPRRRLRLPRAGAPRTRRRVRRPEGVRRLPRLRRAARCLAPVQRGSARSTTSCRTPS
jgi:hypothetical protein